MSDCPEVAIIPEHVMNLEDFPKLLKTQIILHFNKVTLGGQNIYVLSGYDILEDVFNVALDLKELVMVMEYLKLEDSAYNHLPDKEKYENILDYFSDLQNEYDECREEVLTLYCENKKYLYHELIDV